MPFLTICSRPVDRQVDMVQHRFFAMTESIILHHLFTSSYLYAALITSLLYTGDTTQRVIQQTAESRHPFDVTLKRVPMGFGGMWFPPHLRHLGGE
jgi:hypothetical protein